MCSPSTKLLSLEEAQARTQAQLSSPVSPESKYIEVGEGPAALQGKFHTIIEFPMERCVHLSVRYNFRNPYSVQAKYLFTKNYASIHQDFYECYLGIISIILQFKYVYIIKHYGNIQ